MEALILTEGGREIGLGHITRCIALYQAFRERKIYTQLIINADKSVMGILKSVDCKLFDWLKKAEITHKILARADTVIIDSYLAGLDFYKKVSKISALPVYLDDFNRISYPRGLLINGSVYAERVNYKKKKGSVFLLGPKYLPMRKDFWGIRRKTIRKKINTLLLTCGGLEHNDLLASLAERLKRDLPYEFKVLSGENKIDSEEMSKIMLSADICISGGGQTTYELARCAVPAIGICFADNQLLNLREWERIGVLKFAGWYNEKGLFNRIGRIINSLDFNERSRMGRAGQRLIDGQGAKRVVDFIISKKWNTQ